MKSLAVLLLGAPAAAFLAWPGWIPDSFYQAEEVTSPEAAAADAIVLLGGDTGHRQRESLRLLRGGRGRFLLVTGENPAMTRNLEFLLPSSRRVVEPSATSTWENATHSGPLLKERGARSVILVTDWWHTRRAVACFRRACPDLTVRAVAARRPGNDPRAGFPDPIRRREALARLWYGLRYAAW